MKETIFVRLITNQWVKLHGTEEAISEAMETQLGNKLIAAWSRDTSPIDLNYPGVDINKLPVIELEE